MATSFAEALLKSGVVSQSDVEKSELAVRQELIEEEKKRARKKIESAEFQERAASVNRHDNSPEFAKLNTMWENDRSRKFLQHLIYAFIPYTKVTSLFSFAEKERDRKCCLCSVGIMDFNEIMHKNRDMFTLFAQELKDSVEGHEWSPEKKKQMFNGVLEGKLMGTVAEESKCVFCRPCYVTFYSWVMRELMCDNRTISKIVHNLMRGT